jgi:hypothetical protein
LLEDDVDERREARFAAPQRRWPVAGDDARKVGVTRGQSRHACVKCVLVQPCRLVVAHPAYRNRVDGESVARAILPP